MCIRDRDRPADRKAGCKHRCTDAAMNYLKAEVMEMCHEAGLYQMVHSCVCAAVLAACFPVRWPVHVGQHGNLRNPQTVNDDMHMDIFGVEMCIRDRNRGK